MAQTKCHVKQRKISFNFQLDPSLCGTVRAFSCIFSQLLWRTALFTRIDPRCILELLVDISATAIEQCIFVVAPARPFWAIIGGSNAPSSLKIKKK